MSNLIESFDGIVSDMDGVLYRGDRVIPGVPDAVRRIRAAGIQVLFLTNNSASTVEGYLEKLDGFGIVARPEEILTSAQVTATRVSGRYSTAYVVGGDGITSALAAEGIGLLTGEAGRSAELVVVGWDRTFTWDKMRIAAQAVRAGASFVATNRDATFPAPDGLWPGAGAILASIEAAAGVQATVMGKPHEPMMEAARARLAGRSSIAMIGDRPDTDLAGARRLGWTTILVLSGVTTRAEAATVIPPPDHILDSIADL